MIMLTRVAAVGQPDELVFVAPQHIVWVRTEASGDGSEILLSTGYGLMHVAEERDEIVDDIEKAGVR